MNEYTIKNHPVKSAREEIDEAIKANDGYCPCLSYRNEDTKCMCKNFKEQDHNGFCHCGRFIKVKKIKQATIITDFSEIAMEQGRTLQEFLFEKGVNAQFYVTKRMTILTDINKFMDLYYNSILSADSIFYIGEHSNGFVEELLLFAEECGHEIIRMGSEAK